MPAKIRLAGTLSQNAQKAVITAYICCLTNFNRATTSEHSGKLLMVPIALWSKQPKFLVVHGPPDLPRSSNLVKKNLAQLCRIQNVYVYPL